MKVSRCGGEPQKPQTLTWEEMSKKEGVYQLTGIDGNVVWRDTFFVVICENIILHYCPGALQRADKGAWAKYCYIKVPQAEVCFEIRV